MAQKQMLRGDPRSPRTRSSTHPIRPKPNLIQRGRNNIAALRQDLRPDSYQRKSFGDNFRNKYRENMNALNQTERSVSNPRKFNSLAANRGVNNNQSSNLKYSKPNNTTNPQKKSNKLGKFISRYKKPLTGGLVGIAAGASTTFLMLPAITVGEFGQFANWIKDTTQTVHELMTGARSARNVVRSATVAAKSAAAAGIKSHVQTSRVGIFGEMVGRNYLTKLEEAGVKINDSKLAGTWESLEIDVEKTSGSKAFKNASTANQLKYIKAKYPNIDTSKVDLDALKNGKVKFDAKMSYRDTLNMMRAVDSATSTSNFKLGREIKIRYTARMLGINSWLHPIEKLKGMGREKIKKIYSSYKEKRSGKTADSIKRGDYAKDSEGNTDSEKAADADKKLSETEAEAKKTAEANAGKKPRFKGGAVLKGGIAAILLVGLCAMIAAQDNYLLDMFSLTSSIASIHQASTSTWGQVQSSFLGLDNEAIDMEVLGVAHEDYADDKIPAEFEVDENGYIIDGSITKYATLTWVDASAYQATEEGKTVSQDRVPTVVKTMYDADGGWAASSMRAIDTIPILGQILKFGGTLLCSAAAGWIMTALGGLNPVNLISTALMLEPHVSAAVEEFISTVFQIGDGELLDESSLEPDQRADVAYRGSEYVTNTLFATMAAEEVTLSEAYENALIAQQWLDEDWSSRSLASKLFDTTDYRSAIAKIVNGAGINTKPSNVSEHFANWAKLLGAVPSFIAKGLAGVRSAEAKAAGAVAYQTGAPNIEFSVEEMDKITGGGDDVESYDCGNSEPCTGSSWDYDVNFNNYVAPALIADGDDGDLHQYAKRCLGAAIGNADDGFSVAAHEVSNPEDALLVGLVGGVWAQDDSCNSPNEIQKRIGLYTYDYQDMAGTAWYTAPESDSEAQKIAKELGFDGSGGSGNIIGDLSNWENLMSHSVEDLAATLAADPNMKVGLNGKKDMDSIVSTGKLYGCNRAAITDNTKILLALLLTAGANGFHMTDIDPFALGHEGVGTGCSAAHGRGEAVDLGVTLTYDSMPGVEWRGANFYTNQEVPIAFVKLIAQIAEEKGLGSIGVAQFGAGNTCGVTDTPDARYANGFSDSCNHIHLQVTN